MLVRASPDEAELLVHHLGEGRQAVGGAGRVRDDGVRGLVLSVVDADHVDRHGVLSRAGLQ
eukprot:6887742-Alexandrium_andersonii.AAC.1